MKKTLWVAAAIVLAACGGEKKAEETPAMADSTAAAPAPAPAMTDSAAPAAAPTDSAAAAAPVAGDTTKK